MARMPRAIIPVLELVTFSMLPVLDPVRVLVVFTVLVLPRLNTAPTPLPAMAAVTLRVSIEVTAPSTAPARSRCSRSGCGLAASSAWPVIVTSPGGGVEVPFFGEPARMAAGPAALAAQTGAVLMPIAPQMRVCFPLRGTVSGGTDDGGAWCR